MSAFSRLFVRTPRSRRNQFRPTLDGLEKREVPATLNLIPNSTTNNTVVLSVQSGKLEVEVNGVDTLYDLTGSKAITFVVFNASATKAGTTQTFTNSTNVMTQAVGGLGNNVFTAGGNYDYFVGGMGTNNFTAGSGFVIFEAAGTSIFKAGTGSGLFYKNAKTTFIGDTSNYYMINNG